MTDHQQGVEPSKLKGKTMKPSEYIRERANELCFEQAQEGKGDKFGGIQGIFDIAIMEALDRLHDEIQILKGKESNE